MLLLLACGQDKVDPDAPTWYQDVAPIVLENCTGCHAPEGAAFDLTGPEQASGMSAAMAAAVEERRMPPWGAFETEDCTPSHDWVGDRRLSDEEIATLVAWAEADAPLGDEATAAAGNPPASETLTGELTTLTPAGSYTTNAVADEFVCLQVNPGNSEDLWVDAVEVVPTNRGIAHHTLVMLDDEAVSDDLVNADGWYDCAQGTGLGNADLVATWVPGAGPTYAPEGTALRIPGGSRLVLQMHYHPSGDAGQVDQTSLNLREVSQGTRSELHNTLIGNFRTEATGLQPGPGDEGGVEFRIPAGAADHTEEMRVTFPDGLPELPIPHLGAHMHLIAKAMDVWLERAAPTGDEPERECLLSASRYEYDWQQFYRYEGALSDAPTVSGGDTVVIRCTYDNTLDHDGTRRALDDGGLDEPVDVFLGEGTLDEMCIGMFGYVY